MNFENSTFCMIKTGLKRNQNKLPTFAASHAFVKSRIPSGCSVIYIYLHLRVFVLRRCSNLNKGQIFNTRCYKDNLISHRWSGTIQTSKHTTTIKFRTKSDTEI